MTRPGTRPGTRDDRVWRVTGASSGIGRATALAAAEAGAHVVLTARSEGPLQDAAGECDRAGAASTLVLTADIGRDDEVEKLVGGVLERHGRLDVVVNSAGVVAYGRTEDVPPEVFDGVLRTNLSGSVNLARHALRVMREQESGTLLLVGSVIGHVAIPTMTPYAVSKWGVQALARQLRIENRDRPGVHVRYVAPGGVDTPIYDQAASTTTLPGRPPPPASSAMKTGRQVARRVDHGGLPDQLTVLNYPILAGFRLVPRIYDAIIGAVFPLGAADLTHEREPDDGNVLESRPEGNAYAGGHGNAWFRVARNVAAKLRGRSLAG